MQIAFDTSPLVRPYPPGVVRACKGLLGALRELPDTDIVELAPKQGENERHWRQLRLPMQAHKAGTSGVHSPISAFATCGPGRRVSTVHELPWHNNCTENAGVGHRLWARLGVARADAVICPTDFVREQLIADGGGGVHIHSCPWGTVNPKSQLPGSPGEFLARHGLDEFDFCLALGANRPKKNLGVILRALAGPSSAQELKHLHLVVTGHETASLRKDLELATSLGIRKRVHSLGFVEEAERQALSSAASFGLVLSQSEGFGFPVLESLSHGRPVVVSIRSAQAEVAGERGIMADPQDPHGVANAMHAALGFDASRSPQLRSRAELFTWQACAKKVRNIWGAWE